MKSTSTYWNPMSAAFIDRWEIIEGSEGKLSQITIAKDFDTGDYTRLTKFLDGYSTEKLGAKSHDYPEEIFVVSGRLYDAAFQMWLEPGYYASRPPGEVHGPFKADGDVIILEMSYPSQSIKLHPTPFLS
ncbi:MAG: cupin domain-containing protein [Cyanobacteria bacterium P01_A01_bin.84]